MACGSQPATEIAELDTMLRATRVATGRWSGGVTWGACDSASTALDVPRMACQLRTAARRQRVSELSDVVHRAENEQNADALRLRAMLAMEGSVGETDPALPARLIAQALQAGPVTSALLNDAAVVWLWKAERTQKLRDLLQSLDYAERAHAADSLSAPVAFNRALILTRLHLAETAERAWDAYLLTRDDNRWHDEGARYRQALGREKVRAPVPADWRSVAAADRLGAARESPEATREAVWALLRNWGRSVVAGATDTVALVQARAAATAVAQVSGDSTLLQIVERAAAVPDLAEAHAALSAGVAAVQEGHSDAALPQLERAQRTFEKWGSAAAPWAHYHMAVARVGQGRFVEGDSLFQQVLREAPPLHRVLRARTELGLGVSRVRRGDYSAAVAWYRAASQTIAATTERDTRGHTAYVLAEGLSRAGLRAEAERASLRGLGQLMSSPQAPARGNLLLMVGALARDEGLRHATAALADEAALAARRSGNEAVQALALAERARARLAAFGSKAGASDAEEAMRLALALPPGRASDRVRGSLRLLSGEALVESASPNAESEMQEAVRLLGGATAEPLLPRALHLLALTQLQRGDTTMAQRSLERAMAELEAQSRTAEVIELRAAFSETVESVYDLAIELELARDAQWGALATLERARRLAWERDNGDAAGAALLRTRLSGKRGRATLAFALLPTRVVGWCIARGTLTRFEHAVRRDSVAVLAAALHARGGSASLRPASAALFDLLLRPAAGCLAEVERVDVLADRELSLVPFSGLWDDQRREYAVQRHEFTRLTGLSGPSAGPRTGGRGLVASEGGDAGGELPPLPGATGEVNAVLAIHDRGVALRGEEASPTRFAAAALEARVVHFAGHAVNDPEMPALSFLALAPTGKNDDGRLLAREIGKLRLSHVEVVVLSACQTLGARATRGGGVNGLALSFMRAGARGVISTVWDIGDERAGEFVVEVHRGLVEGLGGAEALRRAQLKAIGGGGALSSPQVWAAFTYTGT